jgi:hypothetical protein
MGNRQPKHDIRESLHVKQDMNKLRQSYLFHITNHELGEEREILLLRSSHTWHHG